MAPGNARDHPVAGVSEDGEAVILRLTGELDLYNAPELRKALVECAERNPKRLVVDLGVRLLGGRHRTRLATASRARRAREGRGRPAKTS